MALNSINTNVGAMQALQALTAINRDLATTQNRISTGKKVNSAKDDGATWAIAQTQRSEMHALDAVTASLQRGSSIVDIAVAGGETISDLLNQMKEKALAAADPSLDSNARAALSSDYVALRKQIDIAANNASFNGISLISAGSSGQVRALANSNASSTIDVDHIDLSTGGALLSGLPADLTASISSANLTSLTNAITGVNGALAKLGTGSKALDLHTTFVGKLQDTMEESIGRLVDADMARESTKLAALKVQQQLAIQALSIANQAPSLLLQLFRN
ncbi:flagellin [Caulobacter ginsengisoli]|uniref:Flagellin n=1 Tax=Caulobacter ginsengisoli TaxID=400775 RepID=A0ABU0IMY9_9CAUL|nr:flagellin [Caulobacter ginsengisoli]MDQ0463324.1 flagellin [Caulobacter ginsengisoli]